MPFILTAFTWIIGPIGRYVAIAAIVGGGFLWVKVHYENIGYQKALAAIAAQDLKAKGKADESHKTVSDCFDANGNWNVITGVCDK